MFFKSEDTKSFLRSLSQYGELHLGQRLGLCFFRGNQVWLQRLHSCSLIRLYFTIFYSIYAQNTDAANPNAQPNIIISLTVVNNVNIIDDMKHIKNENDNIPDIFHSDLLSTNIDKLNINIKKALTNHPSTITFA